MTVTLRRRVSKARRARVLELWDRESAAAIARRLKLPVTTVQSIGRRAGKTPKRAGRPRKEA